MMSKKPAYEELEKRDQELEQVELKRKQTEEELAQIFSISLDMICIADINTSTFIKVNPAFTEILGYSVEELLEKPFIDFIHPDDIDATQNVIEKEVQAGAKVINFDNRYRCRDGSYRWLSWVSHPNIEQGVTYAVARDITEWKQNEEELTKSKALLNATGRMAKVGGWEVDANTLEVNWTEETYRIHEVPLDHKPSLQDAINFFHPEDRPKLELAIQRALDHGEPYDIELRFITAQEKHLWTHTKCAPEIVDGKVVKLKGTFQDITERKAAEEALIKSEERFHQLFENMSSGVAVYEPIDNGKDFIFKDFNRAAEKIEQICKSEVIGRRVSEVFPSVIELGLIDVFREVWRTDEPKNYPVSFYKDERIEGWRENSIYKLPSGEIVAVYDDITESKQAEEALNASEKKYRELKASDLLYIHDLEGNLIQTNLSLKKAYGLNPDDLVKMNLRDLVSERYRDQIKD
ncbi:MAG: PAS domain S-box protein, partial [Desulfobacteraceae bacterium]|nr:PAS domain S-box protein [Desulfobacteraceae bacterium]